MVLIMRSSLTLPRRMRRAGQTHHRRATLDCSFGMANDNSKRTPVAAMLF